ncbi:uncharacterized protein LOC110700203 [Chenopodium quinoa]|uniref:uncharacterized protein LOC110700203 n=1 Tax=Chenopodium quinoa TaxID=63459 RepID=UPI000B783A4E|nr:uncharacterized protein LOC110700203 [Chenopodium quinoa]
MRAMNVSFISLSKNLSLKKAEQELKTSSPTVFQFCWKKEEVYMQLPPSYNCPTPGKVCRLHKSLYDYSLFSYIQGTVSLHVLVYVDDLIITVARGPEGIFLSQRKYALDVLSEVGMLGCKPIDTPMEQNHRLAYAEGEPFSQPDWCNIGMWQSGYFAISKVVLVRPMKLYCDSQSALHIAKNPVFNDRTKHIEADCHFVRDELVNGNLATTYVPTGH